MSEQGPYEALMAAKGPFSDLMAIHQVRRRTAEWRAMPLLFALTNQRLLKPKKNKKNKTMRERIKSFIYFN